jgi:peptide/nickel transport system ATP-binding protein
VERGTVDEVLRSPKHPYTQALLAAVPRIRAGRDAVTPRPVLTVDGELPSPVNPPSGCHFHPRCPYAMDICSSRYPPAAQVSATAAVHCWLQQPGDEGREPLRR